MPSTGNYKTQVLQPYTGIEVFLQSMLLIQRYSKAHIPPRIGYPTQIKLTKNMKCTWPTRDPTAGNPTQTIFHWLELGVCVGGNVNFMFCIGGNATLWHWASKPTPGPNVNGFASQWNIGFSLFNKWDTLEDPKNKIL